MNAHRGHFKSALTTIRANRGRSFLTMFGVIVGVASVVTVVGIGEGVKHQLSKQIDQLGKNVLTIRPASLNGQQAGQSLTTLGSYVASGSLSEDDVHQVATAKNVQVSVPLSIVAGTPQGDNSYKNGPVLATTSNLPKVLSQSMAYGGFFANDDVNQDVAVLGQTAAEQLFNQDVPLGRSFTFRGQQFVVSGVFNQFAAAPFSNDIDFNKAIFIPDSAASQLVSTSPPLYEILAKVDNQNSLNTTATDITKRLLKTHGNQQDFSVLKPSQSLAASTAIFNTFTELIVGVAAISLFVGGIGIMNVMLVSVTERMHEIGVRKAVGATNRQILHQFIIEAATLSVLGAFIGIIVSLIIDVVLWITTSLSPVISWQIMILATVVAVFSGIIFGSFPAMRAARKDPIEALRSE